VAAFPVEGPRDVAGPESSGSLQVTALDEDLRPACLRAWEIKQHPGALTPRAFAKAHSWRACTVQFLGNLAVEPDEAESRPRAVHLAREYSSLFSYWPKADVQLLSKTAPNLLGKIVPYL
jgi:hypothetical protein